jgi:hypothetical protein
LGPNPRFFHWFDPPQIAYGPRVCRFAADQTNEKIIEFGLQSEFCNPLRLNKIITFFINASFRKRISGKVLQIKIFKALEVPKTKDIC